MYYNFFKNRKYMYLKIDTEVERFELVFKGFERPVHISDHLEANSKFLPQ